MIRQIKKRDGRIESFDQEKIKNAIWKAAKAVGGTKVAVIDFWAEWCGPCRSMLPIVEKISDEYEGKALIAKINVDDYPEIGAEYGVRNIPFFLFFKDGQVADKHVGTIKESDFKAKIDALL